MKSTRECCVCGDIGFSRELFRCRKGLHRSQHTYCSVSYPHTESYELCDWCLRTQEDRKTPSYNISEYRPFGKYAAAGAAEDGKKQALRGCNDCQRSLPRQHSIRIIKQKSMDKAAVLAHCRGQNVAEAVNPRGNHAEGREFVVSERWNTRETENIQDRQSRKLDSLGRDCKAVFRLNAISQMRDAKASTPRPKVRRYKLLEEVSS